MGRSTEYRTLLGIVVKQLMFVLKCLRGKDKALLYYWDVLLIGRNLGLHILNIATGDYLPERLPCLT